MTHYTRPTTPDTKHVPLYFNSPSCATKSRKQTVQAINQSYFNTNSKSLFS